MERAGSLSGGSHSSLVWDNYEKSELDKSNQASQSPQTIAGDIKELKHEGVNSCAWDSHFRDYYNNGRLSFVLLRIWHNRHQLFLGDVL